MICIKLIKIATYLSKQIAKTKNDAANISI